MAYFDKEFTLDRQENFDAFVAVTSANTSEQYRDILLTYKPTLKLSKSGDEYTLQSSRPDGKFTEQKFKSGVEFDETVAGNDSKSTITVDGDTFTYVMRYPEGDITVKREYTGDELVATYTASKWDGKAVRYFKA